MTAQYLDIMEKALSAYTPERIRSYIDEVRRDGLSEHGFPRLGANIGILMAYGRRTDLFDTFVEIMDLCCEQMPQRKAANDFSIREVCCCLMLMEEKGLLPLALIQKWKGQLASFDPWRFYSQVDDNSGRFWGNWVLFAAVSEYMRGVYCGIDTSEFVEWQLPSQLANLDQNGMYMDEPPFNNHAVYDMVPRCLFAFLLRAGYRGKYASRIEEVLDSTAELTLKMQSVTGELAFGGRSNQFLHNEPMLTAYFEMEATRFAQKGDPEMAGKMKAAALLAAEATLRYLDLKPISHTKNRYDIATRVGCENYGYFNKYMITVASNLYMGARFADDSILPTVAPAEQGGYVAATSERFHRIFLNCGGYFLQWDTNADPHYDGNGLGRVHKRGCPAALCLSVPFAHRPKYVLEKENPGAMSLCCYAMDETKLLTGAEPYARYTLVGSCADADRAEVVLDTQLSGNLTVRQTYRVSEAGVDISLSGGSGFMVPVFEFDGASQTKITLSEGKITVEYQDAQCTYTFEGRLEPEFRHYCNRNGRYRVYKVAAQALHIEMEENYEA